MGSQSILQPQRIVFLCLLAAWFANAALAQTLATTVPLILPSALAFDNQGNFYVAETANHVIRKIDSSGHITVVAGTGTQGFEGDGGQATVALLDSPQGLAVDSTNLYIADSSNHRIRKVNLASGLITTLAGNSAAGSSGDNGPATAATLDMPTALALDVNGNLYVADSRAHRVRKITNAGIITTVAGTGTQGFDGEGATATTALLDSPGGLAVDQSGNLYLADTHNQRVRRIDAATRVITTLTGTGILGFTGDSNSATAAKLALPRGLSTDTQGNLYIADTANHRVRRIDAVTGKITTIAGDGAQGFAGDGASATAASFDSPRSAAISSSNLLTIADTGNQRIRQIDSSASLQTVAGLGALTPGSLAIAGAPVVAYGSGRLTATLSAADKATGNITFLDNYKGATDTAATVKLLSGISVLDTSTLRAGQHAIIATYPGDPSHSGAQSTVFNLTVTPLPLTPLISTLSVTYGEPIPTIVGTLDGILPRDQPLIWATFTSTAIPLSPVGTYPVAVALAGVASGNYTVAAAPAFRITPAATRTTLTTTNASLIPIAIANPGDQVILTAHVVSQTAGLPTGTITIFDGASVVTTGKANSNGDLAFATTGLTAGAHSFVASYLGDTNFLASTSSPVPFTEDGTQAAPADFTLAASGATTQTVVSGNSANFTFTTQSQSSLSSPISLSASGFPNLATASFNPSYIPPGSSNATFTLTIATPKTAHLESTSSAVVLAVLFLPVSLFLTGRTLKAHRSARLVALFLLVLPLLCTGCGDRIYTADRSTDGSKTYTITVTGTSAPNGAVLKHTATVTLVILPTN